MNLDSFYSFWGGWFAQPDELKQERRRRRDPVTGKGSGNWYPVGSEAPGYAGDGKGPRVADSHKEYVHLWWKDVQPGAWARSAQDAWFEAFQTGLTWLLQRGLGAVANSLRPSDQVLRVLHYLPHPTGEVGAVHKDYDLLTVNLPGTVPGLERLDNTPWDEREHVNFAIESLLREFEHGRWISEEEGVHVGEMLEIYTGPRGVAAGRPGDGPGRIHADIHRVRTAPNTDRLKAVFFVLPPMDFVLRPGKTCPECEGAGAYRIDEDDGSKPYGLLCDRCSGACRAADFTAHDYLLGPNGVLVKAGAK